MPYIAPLSILGSAACLFYSLSMMWSMRWMQSEHFEWDRELVPLAFFGLLILGLVFSIVYFAGCGWRRHPWWLTAGNGVSLAVAVTLGIIYLGNVLGG